MSHGGKRDDSVGHVDYGSQIESNTLADQPPTEASMLAATFDEFLVPFGSRVRQAASSTSFPSKVALAVRDIIRPLQSIWWKPWIVAHLGGTGDPSFQSFAQLEVYFEAVENWHIVLRARNEISDELLSRIQQELNDAARKVAVLAGERVEGLVVHPHSTSMDVMTTTKQKKSKSGDLLWSEL